MYLEQRRRRWYAAQEIPPSVRPAILGPSGKPRARFFASLKTGIRSIAARRAAVLEVHWRAEIERARARMGTGAADEIERDALFWRERLLEAPEAERSMIRSVIAHEAEARADMAAMRAGLYDHREEGYDELPGVVDAVRFSEIATGKLVRLEEHLEEYLATLRNELKTVAMKRVTIKEFAAQFVYVSDVRKAAVQRWINQNMQRGRKPATVRRLLSELRGYWRYLISLEVAPQEGNPFEGLSVASAAREEAADKRRDFTPGEVVGLREAAIAKADHILADLIAIAMYTGARIEEICALSVKNVEDDYLVIEDAKTAAGWRNVPLHSKLKPTIRRLKKASKDGFILPGLKANKYGDRAGALGQRFGRLKSAMGYGRTHVFHSIRKTVATMLEGARVPENVTADILGHDKPRVTYGLYSSGTPMKLRREAIGKLRYPTD